MPAAAVKCVIPQRFTSPPPPLPSPIYSLPLSPFSQSTVVIPAQNRQLPAYLESFVTAAIPGDNIESAAAGTSAPAASNQVTARFCESQCVIIRHASAFPPYNSPLPTLLPARMSRSRPVAMDPLWSGEMAAWLAGCDGPIVVG